MTEALVSLVLDQLALIVRQQIVPQVKLMMDVGQEVEKLRNNLMVVQAVLKDAQRRQVMEIAVRDWLNKLRNTSYEIEDVLDEWSSAIAQLRMEEDGDDDAQKKKVSSSLRSYFVRSNQIGFRRAIAIKIKKLNKNLGEIADQRKWFNFDTTIGHAEPQRSKTTAFIDETKICGRENDKSSLISKLLAEGKDEDGNFSIISIVGMGGMGKTTLAKLAYNSREIQAHFEERIWVCVSEPFEEVRVARAIIEAVDSDGTAQAMVELHNLLQYTSKSIEGKKFLLVLDDMWTEEDRRWAPLKQALQSAATGSKILVTTRKNRVAEMMESNHKIYLSGLAQEDSWSLFSRIAFSGRVIEDCEKLKVIGRKIAEECKGLPLAAKTLGSLMRLKTTKEQWQNVLDSKVWKIEQTEREVFAALLLSYHDLSPPLKRCFSYCAIFPKDFYFERDRLVQLWIAQGYLGYEGLEQMEITGREYFEDLAMRCLFVDFVKNKEDNSIIGCKMHHVVHEFSQFLVKNESIFMELESARDILNCKDSDHLNLVRTALFQSPTSFMDLRNLCLRLIGLRSLGLRRCSLEEIPREIGKLIHLRYLDLSYNSLLICLPESICSLFNLQTLNLNNCLSLERLPQSMGKLRNLRHLEIDSTPELNLLPKGIRRMKFLRTLKEIEIGTRDEEFTIGDLKNLNQLRGCLAIHGLANVREANEAKNAEMKHKKHLRRLALWFDGENRSKTNQQMDEETLEALEPNQAIEELSIIDFRGRNLSASWLSSMASLTTLQLSGCSNCVALPCLGKLPSLKLLKIKDLDRVIRVGNEFLGAENSSTFRFMHANNDVMFPSLGTLWFHGMKMWEEWDGESGDQGFQIMPDLHSLIIEECPKLKSLPHFVHSVPMKIFDPL